MKKFISDASFGVVVFSLLCASPAHAYLDGATISLVLQALTGAIATALLYGKVSWARLKGVFSRQSTDDQHIG